MGIANIFSHVRLVANVNLPKDFAQCHRCGIRPNHLDGTPQNRTGADGLMTSEQLSRITALAQQRFETALMMDNPSNQ